MLRRASGDVVYYQFESLAELGVRHGIFTRLGGHSAPPFWGLNVGHTVGDDEQAVEANHQAIYRALDLTEEEVTTAHQVHGCRIAQVKPEDRGRVLPATDALISDLPDCALLLRFADCVPILLYDRLRGAVGLAHAGWRGTMLDIAGRMVRAMGEAFGSDPKDLLAGLGPAIGPCCYEVGAEVIEAARATFPAQLGFLQMKNQSDGKAYFDLIGANAWQLAQAGVSECEVAPFCTSCRADEFFSHRAEAGRTGRFAVLLATNRGAPTFR